MNCPRPDKRRYATREAAEIIAERTNRRDATIPAVPYECICGWWHVGRDKGHAECAWCGALFPIQPERAVSETPPRWCKPSHRKKAQARKRARLPVTDERRVDLLASEERASLDEMASA